MRLLRLGVLALLAAASSTASAQSTENELLEAFFSMFVMGSSMGDASVGVEQSGWPAGIDRTLLPPEASALGGITIQPVPEAPEGPFFVLGFARLDGTPDALAATYATHPLPAGWTAEPSPYAPTGLRLCGPDAHGDVLFAPRQAGGAFVSIAIEAGGCASDPESVTVHDAADVIGDGEIFDEPSDMTDVIGDGEIIDEPVDMADVIGDGEIIDEPADEPSVFRGPDLPRLRSVGEQSSTQSFGFDGATQQYRGTYSVLTIPGGTLASAAADLTTRFETDGWALRSDEASSDRARVQTWMRDEPDGAHVVATAVVRLIPGGAQAIVTATR